MKKNKYTYYKVIQGNYGYGWSDEDWYESDSTGFITDKETRETFKENLNLYRTEGGGSYRVVKKRELNK